MTEKARPAEVGVQGLTQKELLTLVDKKYISLREAQFADLDTVESEDVDHTCSTLLNGDEQ